MDIGGSLLLQLIVNFSEGEKLQRNEKKSKIRKLEKPMWLLIYIVGFSKSFHNFFIIKYYYKLLSADKYVVVKYLQK